MKNRLLIAATLVLTVATHAYSQDCKEKIMSVLHLQGKVKKDSLILLSREAIRVCKTDPNNPYYLVSLTLLSELYNGTVYKDSCLKYAKKAIEVYNGANFKDDYFHGKLIRSLGNAYQNQRQHSDALRCYLQSKELFENYLPPHGVPTDNIVDTYIDCLNDIAKNYLETKQYQNAKRQFDTIFNFVKGYPKAQKKIILSLNNYSGYLNGMGEYVQALKQNEDALSMYRSDLTGASADPVFYTELLNNLGNAYQELGFYQYALPCFTESFAIRQKLFGEQDELYLRSMNNLGSLYLNMRRDEEALATFMKLDSLIPAFEIRNPIHTDILTNLVMAYSNTKNYPAALSAAKRLVEIKNQNKVSDVTGYATALGVLGNVYREFGNYKEAVKALTEAMKLHQLALSKSKTPELSIIKNNLGSTYIAIGNYNEAIKLYESLLKNSDQRYSRAYVHNLMACFAANKQMDKALPYIRKATSSTRAAMQNSLGILSNYEKDAYVGQIDELFHIYKAFLAAVPESSRSTYNELVYNNELLLKGFILRSDQQIRQLISQSGDSSLAALYTKWKENKLSLYNAELSSEKKDNSKLKSETAEIERQIAAKSALFGKEITMLNIDWTKIQSKLSDKEIIIDFFFYREYSNKLKPSDNYSYGAFVIKKGYKSPVWVPLISEKQLGNLLDNNKPFQFERDRINSIYGDLDISAENSKNVNAVNESLFSLIWKPLLPYLKGIDHVYFVPVKRLGAISLLALHDGKGFLIDKYQFIQLQSSTDLLQEQPFEEMAKENSGIMLRKQTPNVALFGGIDYNYNASATNQLNTPKIDSSKFYTDLPLTGLEVRAIDTLLVKSGWQVQVYDGVRATEKVFKSFDGNSPGIVHLATHGYFNPLSMVGTQSGDHTSVERVFKYSKSPFLRAGLLFALGNYTLGGGKFDDRREDGILTAEEISLLDFSDTQLLVLSACETGVGDIRGSEGVFGLQRAFKLAGVKHIIASLWKVSEKGTKKFMEIFYQQYVSGLGIFEAFQQTQKIMKNDYNPYFWSGFMLL